MATSEAYVELIFVLESVLSEFFKEDNYLSNLLLVTLVECVNEALQLSLP
jgi:hypothetical protein